MKKDLWYLVEQRDKQARRIESLQLEIKKLLEAEKRAFEELTKAKQQIAYYRALTKDMKKTISPSKLSRLLDSL